MNFSRLIIASYCSLFWFLGIAASLCGILIIAFQYIIKQKYIALAMSAVFLLLTNSSLGKMFGCSHPLLRYANFLPDTVSDINGFGYFSRAFLMTTLYSFSFALIVSVAAILFFNKPFLKSLFKIKWKQQILLTVPIVIMAFMGFYISQNTNYSTETAQLNWLQQYEEKYKNYATKPQPNISDVRTTIDLYPEQNSYKIKGAYILVNKTKSAISEIVINTPAEITWNSIISPELILVKKDELFGLYIFKTRQKMLPGDIISLNFDFEYKIEPLQGHSSFNAIIENGAFMRISNYFPGIGYNRDNEIEDKQERKKRNMPLQDSLIKADAPLANPYNYEFINFDAVISTSANQTAISVREMIDKSTKNNRNYFHYKAKNIPFRFAVSSADYVVQKSKYNDIDIEILHDAQHNQNITHLVSSIKKSLQYCESNFGKYPYKTFRFAEISSFTGGFAATAYPATIFISEKYFHLNLNEGEGQDIINELAGHELSHQWWGNAQLKPDYREGSAVLTETLAQYTQLMLYKNEYGKASMEGMVRLHQTLYDSEKAFSGEEPLYTSNPDNSNVIYNKGLVKMYELYILIGEKKINAALKNLLAKHKFPLQPAISLDLINELKSVSDESKHREIEALFKL